jgi:ABC-type branched-subunit amino acid transport system ATPase component
LKHKLSSIIRFLRDHHDITVLLIEHDMGMVMEISDDIIVLDHGDVIARGNPSRSSMMKRSLPPIWARMKARSPYERTAAGLSRGGCVLRRDSGAETGLLEVNTGETVALIGANGAGKSTLLMSIFGQPRIRNGQILYRGEDISHKSTHYVASGGIAQAPEGRRIFPDMTVEENLLMGTIPIGNQFAAEDMQTMFDLFPRLKERRKQRAMTMSGGEQQMLAIARALMSRPKLLLLDEPSLGLAPIVVKQIFQTLRELARNG